eukprot:m.11574 g.11574  ORF g.11574 m.11574 type:complete len:104 (+) comp4458_c0_seq1:5575-5886(+)
MIRVTAASERDSRENYCGPSGARSNRYAPRTFRVTKLIMLIRLSEQRDGRITLENSKPILTLLLLPLRALLFLLSSWMNRGREKGYSIPPKARHHVAASTGDV